MLISGSEPSSVILSQTKRFQKLKTMSQKVPKQTEAKKGWCDKPIKLQFQSIFSTENFDALKTIRIYYKCICIFFSKKKEVRTEMAMGVN